MKNNNNGFTLIEILTGTMIVAIIMLGAFQALSAIGVGKLRLIQETSLEKDSIYFSEKLFEMIKKGGTIDYEEYFNRKIVGTTTSSGHYDRRTGFGNFGRLGVVGTNNFGSGFYYCRSGNGVRMGTGGCVDNNLNDADGIGGEDFFNYSGLPQRYGEYSFQFIDYNSNFDDDLGDEDGSTVDPGSGGCTGDLPSNAISNSTTEISGAWNYDLTEGSCTYKCRDLYHTEDGGSTCVSDTKLIECSKPYIGTVWNTVHYYTQTWDGGNMSPIEDTISEYNTTGSSTKCRYKCDINYTWDGSICGADTQIVECGGSIVASATASTSTGYTQTWNGNNWDPVTSWGENQSSCDFDCDSGYYWDGSACSVTNNTFDNCSFDSCTFN